MTTVMRRDPKFLTRKPIMVEHEPVGGEASAVVATDVNAWPYNTYYITHYDWYASQLLAQTIYANILKLHQFQFCAEVHEVSHILGDTFRYKPKMKDWVFEHIDNILCDDHDEHALMKAFPDFSRYIQILLSCLKWATPAKIAGTRLDIDIKTLFLMARFGVIRAGADTEFVRFVLPLIVSSRTGDRQNTLLAAYAIHEYLREKCQQSVSGAQAWKDANSQPTNTPGRGQKQVPIDANDIDAIMSGIQFINSPNYDLLKHVTESKDGLKDVASQVAGEGGPPNEEGTDKFYASTCAQYGPEITRLRNAFMAVKNKTIQVDVFEGELGKKKRQAFKDYKRGVERKTRVGRRQLPPEIDLAVLCDVSSSTELIKMQFMRAVVCLLACLEDIFDVKEALALFNNAYEVLMKFGDRVSKTKIRPYAAGGTVLHNLLQLEVSMWNWRAREKYLVIITDGDILHWHQKCLPNLQTLAERGIKIILVEIVNDPKVTNIRGQAGKNLPKWIIGFASTLEDLPEKVMAQIILPTL